MKLLVCLFSFFLFLTGLPVKAYSQCQVFAGYDNTVCENDVFTITDATAQYYTSIKWRSNGDGHFSNSTLIHPVYYPGPADLQNGVIRLTISVTTDSAYTDTTDFLNLYVISSPFAEAGRDDSICEGSSYLINYAYAYNYASIHWTTSGNGTFINNGTVYPTYIPGSTDISNGNVILTITADAISPPCSGNVSDHLSLHINRNPHSNAGPDLRVCIDDSVRITNSSATDYTSVLWTSSGDGRFDNPSVFFPVYYPGQNDILNRSVILYMTAFGETPCNTATDEVALIINDGPFVNTGRDTTICSTSNFTQTGTIASNYSNLIWTTSGTGTFNNRNFINPVYYPSSTDRITGNVTLTLTLNPVSPCTGIAVDSKIINFVSTPGVEAGPNDTVCDINPYQLTGSRSINCRSFSWTSSGTGHFTDSTALNPVYIPSLADLTSRSVVLTLTGLGFQPCGYISDNRILTLVNSSSVFAGQDATICQGDLYQLVNSSATSYNNIRWTTSGNGSFSNVSDLHPNYIPGIGDIDAGSVVLTIHSYGLSPCGETRDEMVLTINHFEAEAGTPGRICPGDIFPITDANAENYTSLNWTTSGTGYFLNNGTLFPTYIPSASDYQISSIILKLTAYGASPCSIAVDEVMLFIDQDNRVNAGTDHNICEGPNIITTATASGYSSLFWTSSGTGLLINANSLTPTYTPSSLDIAAGSVTLTLNSLPFCHGNGTAYDQVVLTIIKKPVVEAGDDGIICEDHTFTVNSASAINFSSLQWATSGTGHFINNGTLTPTYIPSHADAVSGSVIITLIANGNVPCGVSTDNFILTVNALPIAYAGDDDFICENEFFTVSTATARYYSALLWSTNGTGILSNTSTLFPTYEPSTADIAGGSIILSLTAYSNAPCSGLTTDQMVLNFIELPIVNAGVNSTICGNGNYTISTASASHYSTLNWTSSGNGFFTNRTTLNPTYYPGPADISNGFVVLTLHANGNYPCSQSTGNMTLFITPMPYVDAGLNETICTGESFTVSTASVNYSSSVLWTTSGTGVLINENTLTPTYIPSAYDISLGSVRFTLKANSIAPPCTGYNTDEMTLHITPLPEVEAGNDAVICENESFTVTLASASNYSSLEWSSSGSGTFRINGVIHPEYTPSAGDISNGYVDLTLKANYINPCNGFSTDRLRLNIVPLPDIDAGRDTSICEGMTYQISTASAIGQLSLYWTTTGTGVFTDNNTLMPVYTPSNNDIISGSVLLILHAAGNYPCGYITDEMTLHFIRKPSVNITLPGDHICAGLNYSFSNATASDYSSLRWATSGTGNFSNTDVLNTTYFPSQQDITDGHITLYLIAFANNPCSGNTADSMILTIIPAPMVDAGSDAMICEAHNYSVTDALASNYSQVNWTSSGTGVITAGNSLAPTYLPSASDISNGYVNLTLQATGNTPCTYATSDLHLTIIRNPSADAGNNSTICSGNFFNITHANATNFSSVYWTTSGTGFFSDNHILAPTYTPSQFDITSGSVNLYLTCAPISPCSGAETDMISLTIIPNPVIDAGPAISSCGNSSVNIIGATALSYSEITWTTSGSGTFSNTHVLSPVYYPSAGDIANGYVIIRLTATGNSSCTGNYYDENIITFINPLVVDAGPDNSVCAGENYIFSGASAQHYSSFTWTTSGTGRFLLPGTLSPIYIPSQGDIDNGSVNITLTANSIMPCGSILSDFMTLTFQRPPVVNAGLNTNACENTAVSLNANVTYYSSLQWTTSGTGTFNNPGIANAIYYPSSSDAAIGTIILRLSATSIFPCNGINYDELTLDIISYPSAMTDSSASICSGDIYQVSGVQAANYSSVSWTSSGSGVFSNINTLSPTYTPSYSDIISGSITLTIYAMGISPCSSYAISTTVLHIFPGPQANAGLDASICEGANFTLSTASADHYSILNWISNGNGVFINNNTLTPTYIPSQQDILNGSVSLTLIASGNYPCTNNTSDHMVLTLIRHSVVEAGPDRAVCEGSSIILNLTHVTNYNSLLWSTSGSGYFLNQGTLSPTYVPSQSDIQNGMLILKLTAGNSPCPSVSDSMILTIEHLPQIDAGPGIIICAGEEFVINDAFASGYSSLLWTSSGTGTFDNNTFIHPVYYPSQQDINTGTVILTLNANGAGSCQGFTSDQMILTIQNHAHSYAGADQTICANTQASLSGSVSNSIRFYWTTSGTGNFSNPNSLNTLYTPSQADNIIGHVNLLFHAVSLAPCNIIITDTLTITIIQQASVEGGANAGICEGDNYTVISAYASNYSSLLWTTSGTGVFANATVINPTYLPSNADITNGSVHLRLTAGSTVPCSQVSDEMILSIVRKPLVSAGSDTITCDNNPYVVMGASVANNDSFSWSTDGTGSFINTTTLSPTYIPGLNDIQRGQVKLILSASPNAPCTGSVSDTLVLRIERTPQPYAGPDRTICEGDYCRITGSLTNANSFVWTTNGSGSFIDQNTLFPTYIPGIPDIQNGTVIITLTANGSIACPSFSDNMVLHIQRLPVVDAGPDANLCEGESYQIIHASASNYSSLSWTSSGTGTFTYANTLNPIYTPSAADIITGYIILTLNNTGNNPCRGSISDNMVLNITRLPTVNAGFDDFTCSSRPYNLNGSASNYSAVFWSTSGTGSFINGNALNSIYQPSQADIAAGRVILTLTAHSIAPPCNNINIADQLVLQILPLPLVVVSRDTTICRGTYAHLTAGGGNNYRWNTYPQHNGSDILVNPYTTTIYTVSITDNNGCTATDSVAVNVNHVSVNAGHDTTVCYGDLAFISASASGGSPPYGYLWDNNPSLNDKTIPDPIITSTQSDTYSLTVTDNIGCTGSAHINIRVNPLLSLNAGRDTIMCFGSFINMNPVVNGGTHPYDYRWNTKRGISDTTIRNPFATPEVSSYYSVTVTDNIGCKASDDIYIEVIKPVAVFETGQATVCEGDSIHFVDHSYAINSIITGWHWNFGDTYDSPVRYSSHTYENSGWYNITLTVFTPEGCSNALRINDAIQVFPEPVATFTVSPTSTDELDALVLIDNQSYSPGGYTLDSTYWIFGDGESLINEESNPFYHRYIYEGRYEITLTVIDQNGCRSGSSRFVNKAPGFTVYVPNTFTPNGDDKNGVFRAHGIDLNEKRFEMHIYDRTGKVIFYTNDVNKGWDGTYDGENIPEGSYIWSISVYDNDNLRKEYKGFINLIR